MNSTIWMCVSEREGELLCGLTWVQLTWQKRVKHRTSKSIKSEKKGVWKVLAMYQELYRKIHIWTKRHLQSPLIHSNSNDLKLDICCEHYLECHSDLHYQLDLWCYLEWLFDLKPWLIFGVSWLCILTKSTIGGLQGRDPHNFSLPSALGRGIWGGRSAPHCSGREFSLTNHLYFSPALCTGQGSCRWSQSGLQR